MDEVDLGTLDAQLSPLLAPLAEAVQLHGPVIALCLWQTLPAIALLLPHLHLRWPDRIGGLPLDISATLLPCSGRDQRWLSAPLYSPAEAYSARIIARWYRNETKTEHSQDFTLCDWEEGFRRHRDRLTKHTLGASSYLAIDTMNAEGFLSPGSRPVLGRVTTRNAPRPALLIPGRGTLSAQALDRLAASALALVNLQQVRGARALEAIRQVLLRRLHQPTLVVASSPSDLFALNLEEWDRAVPMHLLGKPPVLEQVHLSLVGRERLQEEQRFQFAVTELRGSSRTLDALLNLAEEAWWAARQSLDPESARSTALPRFLRELERLNHTAPVEAGLLTSARNLLEETIQDQDRAEERREQVLLQADHHFTQPDGWQTAVVVRTPQEGELMRQAMSRRWSASPGEMRQMGLEIKSIGAPPQHADTVITSGYFGARTLDLIFASQARQAQMVVDPIEARVAFAHTARMRHMIARTGTEISLEALDRLSHPLAQVMAPSEYITKEVSLTPLIHDLPPFLVSTLPAPGLAESENQEQLLVTFTDGTSLLCPPDQRFDLCDGAAGRLQQVHASDLSSGDEVILLVEEAQSLFSEQLMRQLDAGILQAQAAKRLEWLFLIASCVLTQKRSARSIHAGLQARGIQVDYVTVRSWIPKLDAVSQATIPNSWRHFHALAQELQIALPEEEVLRYYQAIRRWRIAHRSSGRILVRLMRYAVFGQLDAATLDRVATQWGLESRALLQGTRVLIVDEVVAL